MLPKRLPITVFCTNAFLEPELTSSFTLPIPIHDSMEHVSFGCRAKVPDQVKVSTAKANAICIGVESFYPLVHVAFEKDEVKRLIVQNTRCRNLDGGRLLI